MPTQVPPSKNSLEDAIVEIQTERKQNLKVSIIYSDKWEQSQASSSQIPNFPESLSPSTNILAKFYLYCLFQTQSSHYHLSRHPYN